MTRANPRRRRNGSARSDVAGSLSNQARSSPRQAVVRLDGRPIGELVETERGTRFTYDAAFAHASLHWIGPYPETARLLYAWLRPGGRIAITLGGVTPALAMMEASLPSAAAYESMLHAAGFEAARLISEPGLLLVTATRPV